MHEEPMTRLLDLLPSVITLALVIAALLIAHRLLNRYYGNKPGSRMSIQIKMMMLGFLGVILLLLTVPISDAMRGQLFSFLGILLSAIIALSSTTFVGNMMAGFMLGSLRSFQIGDFIQVDQHFGRVSERGLLHVEIQTEDRDLTTLPNLFLVTQPVKVVHKEGTVVSAQVSLGYEVPRQRIEALLIEAAGEAGLQDPFVQILELGDFSVLYRIAGMLPDPKQILSARSRLRACMLDALHGADIEIVSPSFMNQRRADEVRFVPPHVLEVETEKQNHRPEKMLFDKADEAESTEKLREKLHAVCDDLQDMDKQIKAAEKEDKEELQQKRQRLEERRARLEAVLARREQG